MTKEPTHPPHHELARKELVMIVAKDAKFVGKCEIAALANIDEGLELTDCVQMIDMATDRGMMTIGMYLGDSILYPSASDCMVVVTLQKKSSYFETYYKATTNLTIGKG